AFLKAGDHMLCSRSVFGATRVLFEKYLRKFGVEITYVELLNVDDWQAKLQPNTKLLFLESPSNPLNEVADIRAIAALAKQAGALFAVDNCFCTPASQQPLAQGAYLVIHSVTIYIYAQGRRMGGSVVGSPVLIEQVVG